MTPAQTLWVAGPLPGQNEIIAAAKGAGGTGAKYSRLKRQWTETVWALAKAARLAAYPPGARVYLGFVWREKNRARDLDNVAAGKKFVLDGLVKAGILATDGWAGVVGWTDSFEVSAKPGVLVNMYEANS